jgi:hypothetical protein
MSIDYELAKELKDAGFPQTQFEVFCKHGCPPFNQHEESRLLQCGECHLADLVCSPTLEELIEACGGFENLCRDTSVDDEIGWLCNTTFPRAKSATSNGLTAKAPPKPSPVSGSLSTQIRCKASDFGL